jgi:hypothetical protein
MTMSSASTRSHPRIRRIMFVISVVLCGAVGGCGLVTFMLGAFPLMFPNIRLPLGRIGGIAMTGDTVIVASRTSGRILRYSSGGNLITWDQMPARPITLSVRDGRLLVSYSGTEHELLRRGSQHVFAPAPTEAVQEQTWWGHPVLRMRKSNGWVQGSLQPWYFTLVQSPYPGLLYGPLLIAILTIVRALARKRRQSGSGCGF